LDTTALVISALHCWAKVFIELLKSGIDVQRVLENATLCNGLPMLGAPDPASGWADIWIANPLGHAVATREAAGRVAFAGK
jgi:hypothetical protein